MATTKQKRIAKLIIENATLDKPLNAGQLLEKGRYTRALQIQPSRVLKSQGVQEELKRLGFDEDSAKIVVAQILNDGKDENKLKAADMIFKVQSTYAPEKSITLNIDVKKRENLKQLANKVLKELKDGTT